MKEINVVEMQLNDWMTDDILLLKKIVEKKSYFGVNISILSILIFILLVVKR